MKATQPIGIFDSGVGGLTVARAVSDLLPHENIIYFGDTEHMPYGERSAEAIQHFSQRICETLLSQQCKCLLVACSTASAVALDYLQAHYGKNFPIFNVIDPVVEHIETTFAPTQKIGIIATKRTIHSGIYPQKIKARCPSIAISDIATPLLAAVIEEGFGHHAVGRTLMQEYLKHPRLADIDALVLGCTHYSIVRDEILKLFERPVTVIDPNILTAQKIRAYLTEQTLLNTEKTPVRRFYVSDYTESFHQASRLFFGDTVTLEHFPLWD